MFINPTKETLELTRHSLANGRGSLTKGVTISTGLVWYDLQAPSKNIYPVITPLRNSIPRVQRMNASDAARWKQVTALTGSGYDAMGWVPEGQRSGTMSYTASQRSASYVTIGEEDYLTFEAEAAAQGLEDENSMVTLRLLQKMMRKEEIGLLAGNAFRSTLVHLRPLRFQRQVAVQRCHQLLTQLSSLLLHLKAGKMLRSPLGWLRLRPLQVQTVKTLPSMVGSSNKSSNTTQAVTLGQTLFASVTTLQGAIAYAWFVGTAGNETLQAITTLNSVAFTVPLTTGRQAATVVTGDSSSNPNYAFDGLLTQSLNPSNLAYVNTLPTGTQVPVQRLRLQAWFGC